MPHLQGVADELCMIRTLHTDHFNHAPSQMFMLTGFPLFGRPSIGSWVNYGIGSDNSNLPGFVVLITGQVLGAGNSAWGSGFLPTVHQGIEFRSQGDPVLFLSNPGGVTSEDRRQTVDAVKHLNQLRLADGGDPEIATRISQYEMAYRMQSSVPELMDISKESKEVHELYGNTARQNQFRQQTVCSPDAWLNVGCALCSCLIKAGTTTEAFFKTFPGSADRLIARLRH